MKLYGNDFYQHRHEETVHAAETILSIVQDVVAGIKSAVDVGCGVGTWLYVLQQRGVSDICGVDGSWVDKDLLNIQQDQFLERDLSNNAVLDFDRKFDLAITLEVAEHLPPESATHFVSSLAGLSDLILFSAATPGQGGVGHVNEQWPNYWIELFESRGYLCIDVIRKRIWHDEAIPLWYRQNTLLFVRKNRIDGLTMEGSPDDHIPPEIYLVSFKRAIADRGIKQSSRDLLRAVGRRIKKMFANDG